MTRTNVLSMFNRNIVILRKSNDNIVMIIMTEFFQQPNIFDNKVILLLKRTIERYLHNTNCF